MNGREVFRVATRLMVSSAEQLLAEVGATMDDIDLYVAHQANQRIIDHAAKHLGLPSEKVFLEHRALRQHVGRVHPDRPGRGCRVRVGSSRGCACS